MSPLEEARVFEGFQRMPERIDKVLSELFLITLKKETEVIVETPNTVSPS